MQVKTYQETIDNVDWSLMQQQKKTLEILLSSATCYVKIAKIPYRDVMTLWGLIDLIETLQDMHETEIVHSKQYVG